MQPLTEVYGLEDFGLRSRKDLARLGHRKVTVGISWSTPPLESFLHLSPRERQRLVSKAYWQGVRKILSKVPGAKQSKGRLILKAESLARMPKITKIGALSLISIRGMKRRRKRQREVLQSFAVLVRLVEEVAGKHRGMQHTDDRTVTVRAMNPGEARLKVGRHFRRTCYTSPYVLPSGTPVRWHLEEILEVRRFAIDPLEDGITTVWYSGGKRRMKPGSGWRP